MAAESQRAPAAVRSLIATLAAAVACVVAVGACGTPPPPVRNAQQQAALSTSQAAARALARGDLAQAQQLYERALAAADAVEDFALAGALLNNLALVHERRAEHESGAEREAALDAAEAQLARVLNAPQRYGSSLLAVAATRSALVALDRGRGDAALRAAEQATAACAAPCPHAATLALVRAQLAWSANDATGTARHAEHALALASAAGQRAEQANALRQLCRAHRQLGLHPQAAAELAQALAIDQALGLPERIALDLLWAGDVERARGQGQAAGEFYERAQVVSRAAGLSALLAQATQARDGLKPN